jgi:hypothetical protein
VKDVASCDNYLMLYEKSVDDCKNTGGIFGLKYVISPRTQPLKNSFNPLIRGLGGVDG